MKYPVQGNSKGALSFWGLKFDHPRSSRNKIEPFAVPIKGIAPFTRLRRGLLRPEQVQGGGVSKGKKKIGKGDGGDPGTGTGTKELPPASEPTA